MSDDADETRLLFGGSDDDEGEEGEGGEGKTAIHRRQNTCSIKTGTGTETETKMTIPMDIQG